MSEEKNYAVTRPKLLLADDSVTIRNIVEQTFADEGVDVTTAANGQEAMEKFVEIQPDIVIADVNMPEPDGYRICEMIKQDEMTKHIPVLLIVGSFEPFDQEEAERVGADGFLTKPFQSISDLVIRVEELLGTEHGQAIPAETIDIDILYDRSFGETGILDEDSSELLLGDAGMDDEIIEMSHPLSQTESRPIIAEKEIRTIEKNVDVDSQRDTETVLPSEKKQTHEYPSTEFIDLIARRVVEKLSDKIVREIAREAVPRIAETLIREALEDEKKN